MFLLKVQLLPAPQFSVAFWVLLSCFSMADITFPVHDIHSFLPVFFSNIDVLFQGRKCCTFLIVSVKLSFKTAQREMRF